MEKLARRNRVQRYLGPIMSGTCAASIALYWARLSQYLQISQCGGGTISVGVREAPLSR
jgi:hypothetical protein